MKPQVFMSTRNGQLVVGRRIYLHYEHEVEHRAAEVPFLISSQQELGWAIFLGDECLALWTDEQIKVLPFEWLGEL